MNRDTRTIIELGIIYCVCVIVLDFFLANYDVLLWPALGVASIFLALLIIDSLLHLTTVTKRTIQPEGGRDDELSRLQEAIDRLISKHETQPIIVEKLRAIGLSVVSARMNLPKERLAELINCRPSLVDERLKDEMMLSFLSGGKLTLTDVHELDEILSRIERM